jgi:hypothetical protein
MSNNNGAYFIITIINSAVIPVNTLISAVRIFTKKVKYIDCVNFNCNGIYYAEGCGKSTRVGMVLVIHQKKIVDLVIALNIN